MSRNTFASISLAAIQHNFEVIRKLAPDSKIASVVKADGYGHGIQRVAGALKNSDLLAVATPAEAVALRDGGWSGRLLMLEGYASVDDFELARSLGADTVIHHRSQLEILKQQLGQQLGQQFGQQGAQRADGNHGTIWLKLDTGMHRLGFPLSDLRNIYMEITTLVGDGSVTLMSHFACADEPGNTMTDVQIQAFDQAVQGLVAGQSLANSAGVLNFPASHRDFVRPGIMLYGISPSVGVTAAQIGLKPAMTLSSELLAINECRKGDTVGYGATYQCPEDMRIGVAAIGYGDGYPRQLRNGTPVLVNGRKSCLAGRVSMDLITLDLRGHDDAVTGDPVVLWGEGLPIESVAAWADDFPYGFICGVTSRVPRVSC